MINNFRRKLDYESKTSGDRPNFTNAPAAKIIKNKAGKPPRLEIIRTPSMPEFISIIKATTPIVIPQMTLIPNEGSGLSGEIPVELSPLIAEVLESEAVTKERNKIITKRVLTI